MVMMISPFGQLGLWVPTSRVEMYSHRSCMFSHTPVIEESKLSILVKGKWHP
jgi:hypothetical protein